MTIAGNLRTMNLADIMQWLSSNTKTGTFIIDGPRYTKRVLFRRGDVVGVASDNPREMLGYFLVGWGYCSEEELKNMIEMQDHFKVMLGELAVNLGHLTRAELEEVLVVKTRETVFDLITWDHGDFRFVDSELPDRASIEIQLPVMSFLFEGFRQRDERLRMREVIPSGEHVPILIAPPDGFGENDMAILQQMDGRQSIADIAIANRLAEFDILKLTYTSVLSGLVQIQPPELNPQLPGRSASPWLHAESDVRDLIIRGRFLDAFKLVTSMREKFPPAKEWVEHMLRLIDATMTDQELPENGILESSFDLEELFNLDCDPAEGFVLSRISGTYTVGEILKQLPGPSLTNRVIIHNLLRRGLVKARSATSVRRFLNESIDESVLEP